MIRKWTGLFLIAIIIVCHVDDLSVATDAPWAMVDEGLFYAEFTPGRRAMGDRDRIIILKIDPDLYEFKLLCASERGHGNLTVKQWCERYDLMGAINAGMYQQDYASNVGYMKNYGHINNRHVSSRYHSVVGFHPVDSTRQKFRIHDTDEENVKEIMAGYHTVIQNLRLIKRPAQNRWSQQEKRWSEAALGEDTYGNALLIFCRQPFSMHDLNNILISLPIDIACAQHLEGGPEASLYFSHRSKIIEAVGSYETGLTESLGNSHYWAIPNVIGFVKKHE